MSRAAAPRTDDFERYLLARMRGPRARAELARRGAPAGLDLPEPATTMEVYAALLGPPQQRAPTPGLAPGSPFAGSIAWRWTLPTWPSTPFVINEHPDGWPWITGFVRPGGAAVPPAPPALHAWDWLRGEIEAALPTERLDAWDQHFDVRARGADGRPYRLRFDFELLQDVEPLNGDHPQGPPLPFP